MQWHAVECMPGRYTSVRENRVEQSEGSKIIDKKIKEETQTPSIPLIESKNEDVSTNITCTVRVRLYQD